VRTGRFGLDGEQTDLGGSPVVTDRDVAAADDSRTATATETVSESGADDESDAVDPELLTDEDRVRRALRERDGRMKQSDVVEELGWSKSKTSRVLSRMADAGGVEKLRIGRENVIDLADGDDAADEDRPA
ncbi:helix-turn-helix domain-containing protein, partial [Halorubrum sp. AJ67]|uniref:helix-turn-helix transcriptional regulator n=1 Tax=Halorubrum sp. AJ67 TaxID=1173487 RepID=UPI00064F9C48